MPLLGLVADTGSVISVSSVFNATVLVEGFAGDGRQVSDHRLQQDGPVSSARDGPW